MLANERNQEIINQFLRKRQLDSELSALQTCKIQHHSIHSQYNDCNNNKRLPEDYNFLSKPFPRILREILSNPQNNHCIGWTPDGNAFRIVDPQKFIEQVLPRYFGNKCDVTFIRNLIRWNFRPITFGPNNGAWYNPHFAGNKNYGIDDYNKREKKIKVRMQRNNSSSSQNLRQFQRSKKPLKKRPVDASLFVTDVNKETTKNVPKMHFSPLMKQQQDPIAFGGIPSHTFRSSHASAPSDTQSVIQAAMEALIRSSSTHSPSSSIESDISTLVKQSNSYFMHPFKEQLAEAQARIKFGYNTGGSFF